MKALDSVGIKVVRAGRAGAQPLSCGTFCSPVVQKG